MIKQFFNNNKYNFDNLKESLFDTEFNEKLNKEIFDYIGLDINDEQYKNLLIESVEKSKYKAFQWLVQKGINVNITNKYGQSLFDIVVEKNRSELLNILLKSDSFDINKLDKDGRTYLQNSVVLGFNEIAKIFIENGIDINSKDNNGRNVLYDALSFGNINFIEYLLTFDKLEINNIDNFGNSIMYHKEVRQNDDLAISLIKKGANTTFKNSDGSNFLLTTILKGIDSIEVVQAALEDEKVSLEDEVYSQSKIVIELTKYLITLEDKSLRTKLLEMFDFLLSKGANLSTIDKEGNSCLIYAVESKDLEVVKYLLKNKIDPNIKNNEGQTALSLAVYDGMHSFDIISNLCSFGIDLFVKNNDNQTIYEILNELILYTHGKKEFIDSYLQDKVIQDARYIEVLQYLLEKNEKSLDILDSNGNPLFFEPLLNDYFPLFRLYIKNGLNIHNKNTKNHNVLFEYVLKVFEDNKENTSFQNNISMLLSNKVEHNIQDETGYTIVHKILGTPCNTHLFDILTDVILFDYTLTDKLGRSAMHTAIWHDQSSIMKRIHNFNSKVVNIPDVYGILPMTYAALLGNQKLVLVLIELNANVKSHKKISAQAIEKFKPLLKNLDKLTQNIEDEDTLRKISIVVDQVKRDFKQI